MKITFTFILILLFSLVKAQQPDSLKIARVKHLSKELSIPDGTSEKVLAILDTYKKSANKAVNDKTLKPEQVKYQIRLAMEEKNQKLALLLNEGQLNKVVPTTERPKKH